MNRLQPCPSCDRHVRSTDAACPFCAAPIAPEAPRPIPTGRLTRAAIFASALATGGAAACGSGQSKAADPQPATADAGIANTADDNTPDTQPDAGDYIDPREDEYNDFRDRERDYDPNAEPMPYGAPPARKRLV